MVTVHGTDDWVVTNVAFGGGMCWLSEVLYYGMSGRKVTRIYLLKSTLRAKVTALSDSALQDLVLEILY